MNKGTPRNVMSESDTLNGSLRRRSPRLSSPTQANILTDKKMATTSVPVKRSITVRKIAPRKTVAPSEHNKENTPRRSAESDGTPLEKKKQKVSTPGPTPARRDSSSAKKKKQAAMPSPILPSTPPPPLPPAQPEVVDPEDAVWSQKVRRSYSRLSDKSFNSSPDSRETLFGFEKLQTPEVFHKNNNRCKKTDGVEASGSLSGLNSFTSLLEAEDGDGGSAFPDPDLNIPGVVVVKEKRKRMKKVQQINTDELDALAAEMNAVFEEAEEFELMVE